MQPATDHHCHCEQAAQVADVVISSVFQHT